METQTPQENGSASESNIRVGEKLSYGIGNFAIQMIFNPATSFIVFFYTDVVGIAASAVGTLLLFSRVFDLLNLGMGMVVDRTKTRYGKGRPWLLWLAFPFGISAVLLFTAPALGPVGKIIYAFVTYNLALAIMVTAVDIPYTVLLPLITSDQHQRTLLSLFRMVFSTLGMLASYAITLPMVKFFGGGATGWQRAFMAFGAVGTALFLLCFAGTKERVAPVSPRQSKISVREEARALFRNRYLVMIAGIIFSFFMVLGLLGSNVYYCRYVLHNVDLFGPLMTAYQVSVVVAMILVGPLLKRLGKRNTALWGTAVVIVGQITVFFGPQSFPVVLTGTILKGLGIAPLNGVLFAMVADTIEYGEWKHGVRAEGTTFGALALVARISVGMGNALVGFILGRSGYLPGAAAQPASALLAMKAMFLHLPLVLVLIIGAILCVYRLDRQYPAIVGELKARKSAAA